MNLYYTTMSPDSARHILLPSESEAIQEAKRKVNEDGRVRYVCVILYKVEPEEPPARVIKLLQD